MKLVLNIVFILIAASSFGQEWRDSLSIARQAYEDGEFPKAVKYYESAQKKAPDNIDLSDEIAQSAYKAREFEKAEKIYQQNAGSKNSSVDKAANDHNIGNSRMKRKDYQGAIEAYKNSLRNNPNDDKTRYNLSEAIRQLKNQQEQNKNNQNEQPKDQNQSDQEKQDQKDQEGGKQEGNQGEKKPGDQQNDQNGKPKDSNRNEGQGGDSKSKLPNKTADRMLDKLMKEEAETKRKLNGGQGKNTTPKSGKDW